MHNQVDDHRSLNNASALQVLSLSLNQWLHECGGMVDVLTA